MNEYDFAEEYIAKIVFSGESHDIEAMKTIVRNAYIAGWNDSLNKYVPEIEQAFVDGAAWGREAALSKEEK